jgi:hypothetical protein
MKTGSLGIMEETIKISLRRSRAECRGTASQGAVSRQSWGNGSFKQTAHFCDSDGVSTDLGFMQRQAVTIGKVR